MSRAKELTAKLIAHTGFKLGEGLHWGDVKNELFGVDIHAQKFWSLDVDTQNIQTFQVKSKIGWCISSNRENIVLTGQGHSIQLLDTDNNCSVISKIDILDANSRLRLNDAKVDTEGNIWGGAFNENDPYDYSGFLYCLDKGGKLRHLDHGYGIPNGPALSPDESILLHSDSLKRLIYAFDLDVKSATLSNKRVWKTFSPSEGFPDGMTYALDGSVWVAHWGLGQVRCYNRDGNLISYAKIPALNVSSVCFGGESYKRLFVTTAQNEQQSKAAIFEPFAGGVFEILGHEMQGIPSGRILI